jgi:hypothetical protein
MLWKLRCCGLMRQPRFPKPLRPLLAGTTFVVGVLIFTTVFVWLAS